MSSKKRIRRALAALLLVPLSAGNAKIDVAPSPEQPNVLLVIADDLGTDALRCYNPRHATALTPNIDRLCRQGVKFTRAWSQPSCTPSRTALLTGRYGFRTGSLTPAGPFPPFLQRSGTAAQLSDNALLGFAVDHGQIHLADNSPFMVIRRTGSPPQGMFFGTGPRDDELTLPQALSRYSSLRYSTAAIGKWHLSNPRPDLKTHPALLGFEYFAGSLYGGLENYSYYSWLADGADVGWQTEYATTRQVNEALDWINERDHAKPWFLYLALNAPHDPYHKPPSHLISPESQKLDPMGINPANAHLYHRAMIEALDHEVGRLIKSMDSKVAAKTYVIFVGDNGTVGPLIQYPFRPDQGKGSMYQGGIGVPMIVTGPGIRAMTTRRMVNFVDMFPTVLDLTRANGTFTQALPTTIDGISFAPTLLRRTDKSSRRLNFAEQSGYMPTGLKRDVAITDGRFKLIVHENSGVLELYDLDRDPYERTNLIAQGVKGRWARVVTRLQQAIGQIRSSGGVDVK